jgi:hypothetical protein
LQAENLQATKITTPWASITTLLTNNLTAATANIMNTLTASTANISSLNVNNLRIGGVTIENYIRNLIAQTASTQSVTTNSADEFTANTVTTGDLTISNASGSAVAQIDNQGNANFQGNISSHRNIADEMEARFLTTQDLQVSGDATVAGELTAQELIAESARIAQLKATTATVSGTLYADRIESNFETRQISDFEQRVRDIVASERATQVDSTPENLVSDPDVLALVDTMTGEGDTTSTPASTDEFGTVITEDTTSTASDSGTLTADGSFTRVDGDLSIAGLLSADLATFDTSVSVQGTILGESFLSFVVDPDCELGDSQLCSTFAIQPSGDGKLSLMAGMLTLSRDGGVVINSDVLVAGKLTVTEGVNTNELRPLDGENLEINLAQATATDSAALAEAGEHIPSELIIRGDNDQEVAAFSASGSARFRQVIIASDNATEEVAFDSLSTTYSSNATTGTATLSAGKLKVVMNNPMVTPDTLIYVTPQGSTSNQVLYVASKQADDPTTPENEGRFTVAIDTSIDSDITFTYWLVN